ncbi:MAG TPA: hypothetical protein VFY78_07415, partial [Gammaproteobacteria bacterium]|nr:hypothetical protein [Gammaproteobacteria bacterium]
MHFIATHSMLRLMKASPAHPCAGRSQHAAHPCAFRLGKTVPARQRLWGTQNQKKLQKPKLKDITTSSFLWYNHTLFSYCITVAFAFLFSLCC